MLESCGGTTAKRLISYLEEQCNLIIDGSAPCSALEDIGKAFYEASDSCAEAIIDRMHGFLHLVHKNAANAK